MNVSYLFLTLGYGLQVPEGEFYTQKVMQR